VPPPDGEDSAYNAPTKVGELGLIHQLMAQAEGMAEGMPARIDTVPPPQSGERSLTTPKPKAIAPEGRQAPAQVIPAPAAIPRMYEAYDDGDEQSGLQQSGGTKVMEVGPPPSVAAASASVPPVPVVAVASSAPPVGAETIAVQLDAYRASTRPASTASDAKLVFVVCALVTLGIAALYFFFLAA
jgi:hypothetical protein